MNDIVRFTVDGDSMYLTAEMAEEYRRRFDEQSAKFSEVLEEAVIESEPVKAREDAQAYLDDFLADIEREGRKEQRRWTL